MTESSRAESGRLWSREFVLLLVMIHLVFVGYYSMFVVLPAYLDDSSKTMVGIVVGVFGIATFATRLWAGSLADLMGRRTLLLVGLALTVVALLLYAQGPFAAGLIPVRLLHGLAWVLTATSFVALNADIAPAARRGEAISYVLLASESAALYAPFASLWIGEHVSFRVVFVGLAVLAIVSILIVRRLPSDRGTAPSWRMPTPFRVSRAGLLPLAAFIGVAIAIGAQASFLVIHADEKGLGNPQLFFLAHGIAVIAIVTVAGRVLAALGYALTTFISLLLAGAAMLTVALAQGAEGLILGGALFGVAMGGSYTAAMTQAYTSADPAGRARAMATVALAFDIGATAAVPFGAVADAAGTRVVFAIAAGIAAVAAFVPFVGRRAGGARGSRGA